MVHELARGVKVIAVGVFILGSVAGALLLAGLFWLIDLIDESEHLKAENKKLREGVVYDDQ